jgi:hypothetical protein
VKRLVATLVALVVAGGLVALRFKRIVAMGGIAAVSPPAGAIAIAPEDRFWIGATLGDAARDFFHEVDVTNHSVALYGLERMARGNPEMFVRLRAAYLRFEEAAAKADGRWNEKERATIRAISANAREFLRKYEDLRKN